ncbi:hypothetical protein COCON_G00208200 [Conger conger]|uniref:Uncharacterized protein n=1 Tax=Conger conger TaxID=82655 RepID=A0A9Q1D0K9_CONCO|nr:hypothetical protein COCON_G00208200 [Conger conger]
MRFARKLYAVLTKSALVIEERYQSSGGADRNPSAIEPNLRRFSPCPSSKRCRETMETRMGPVGMLWRTKDNIRKETAVFV